jgi:hypothetical protein
MRRVILGVRIGRTNYIRIKNNHMSNRFFLGIVSALLLLVGCTNEEIVNEQQAPEEGKITLTASVPGESPETRLSLTPDLYSKNIVVTWKEGDMLQFYFKQGVTIYEPTFIQLALEDITMEGKRATFTLDIPQGIDNQEPYTVWAIHGTNSRLSPDGDILVNVSPIEFTAFYLLKNVPIMGKVDVAAGASIGVINFEHLGVLQCLTMSNSSGEGFTFTPSLGFANQEAGTDWYYTATEGAIPYYNLTSETVQNVNESLPPLLPPYGEITIPQLSGAQLVQWVRPIADTSAPEIVLNALPPMGEPIVSANTKPARAAVMQTGRAYHLYALWDGTSLYFTDDTFTPPALPLTGNLMHADGGDDFIGVVYSKGDGNVYYNSTKNGNTWLGETLLGTGTEARIAIDQIAGSYKPHVVFTSDNKIAYTTFDGANWTDLVYIESNFSGSCYKPDIDVDGSGYAHITYTDTKGGNPGPYLGGGTPDDDLTNIMYATNTSGSFTKAVVFDGYAFYPYDEYRYDRSRIAVDADGTYYIIAHKYANTYGTIKYYLEIKTSSNAKGKSSEADTDQYDIYDLQFVGENARALYKDNNVNRMARIQVSGSTASFVFPYDFSTPGIVPHGLSRCGYEAAGLSGSNLFVRYLDQSNPVENVFSDITVKSGTQVAAVDKGDALFTVFLVYTDNADSSIKVREVQYTPPS